MIWYNFIKYLVIESEMGTSICKLCKEDKNLKESHILSKFVYKKINHNNSGFYYYDGKLNLTQLDKRQLKSFLLCGDCEQFFSKNETIASKIFRNITEFSISQRKWLVNNFPPNPQIVLERIHQRYKLSEEDKKAYDYFNRSKFETLKFFCLGILIREYYNQEKPSLSKKIAKKIEKYFLENKKLNVQMHIYVNINNNDFMMGSTSHTINSGKFFHTHFIFPDIFVYMHIREDTSIEQDEFIVLPEDFYNPHETNLALISSFNYFRKLVKESRISQNAKTKLKSDGIF